MSFHVVIPARYGSTRLPGKALLDIHGKPMIQWVVDAAARSRAQTVFVATDDARIVNAVRGPRSESVGVITRSDHASGTDRIAEVAQMQKWPDDAIVVNVQGDEPHLQPILIDQVAELLATDARAAMATLCAPIRTLAEFLDPNVVKVVAADGAALYFSRAPIPWNRDTATELATQREFPAAFRHIGIYSYRVAALKQITRLSQSRLERIEKLEQLRAMEAGMRIAVAIALADPGFGIDTAADLERARMMSPPS